MTKISSILDKYMLKEPKWKKNKKKDRQKSWKSIASLRHQRETSSLTPIQPTRAKVKVNKDSQKDTTGTLSGLWELAA